MLVKAKKFTRLSSWIIEKQKGRLHRGGEKRKPLSASSFAKQKDVEENQKSETSEVL